MIKDITPQYYQKHDAPPRLEPQGRESLMTVKNQRFLMRRGLAEALVLWMLEEQLRLESRGFLKAPRHKKFTLALTKWKLLDEVSQDICFHLSELANFSPKYQEKIDEMVKQKTKEKFLEKLRDFQSLLFEKHEVEVHFIPAEELLNSWLNKKENL